MTKQELEKEIAELRGRLAVAEQTLSAIYHQEVDALVVAGPQGDQVFSLQGAEMSYRVLVETMNEGAVTLLPNGTILYCNSRFADMVKCPLEKVAGSSWESYFNPHEKIAAMSLLQKAGKSGRKGEFTLVGCDGSASPVQLSVRAVQLHGLQTVSVLVTDIAELRQAHQALHGANEQLESRVRERTAELAKANEVLRTEIAEREQAERALAETQAKLSSHAAELERRIRERTADLREKVAELEIFAYSISHDLRAPLRAIKSFSQIVLDECAEKLDFEHTDFLKRVVTGAHHLDTLIQEVLLYSRTSRAKLSFGRMNVESMIGELVQNYSMFQPPAAQINVRGPLPAVIAHEALLTQCLSNLLGNAVKFVEPETTPIVNIHGEASDKFARIWFEDNGIGIDPADHERIFKIFERVHAPEDFPGTGLGLSIVKKAVERMGGSVGVESSLNQGSRFWFQLPLAT